VKRTAWVCLLLAFALSARAQSYDESRNTLYLELLGNAYIYSLNYDRVLFAMGPYQRVGCRAGISFLPVTRDSAGGRYPFIFPLTANYLVGRESHWLEVGAGATPRIYLADADAADREEHWEGQVSFCGVLAYRYQNVVNDFSFRIGFTPVFFRGFRPWFGLSLGRAF
jgi:hypothetical protein